MQFSISTVIAALGTTAAGWNYDGGCILKGEGAFIRDLAGPQNLVDCFAFGEDMPGTSCVEEDATTTAGPCIGRELTPLSIDAEGKCDFYSEPYCKGDALSTDANSLTCVTGQEFLSYKCSG
ncbi:hypothetical protein FHETE_6008 [Fusarium heterosporum]|uniref:Uncharacterized protein n=1 Tax=Fusarium heterosporum TaxID=42747 RepID=A0A8H5TDL1_FUSHE|nr:hypothetical protein FHETE_6008 [Fusarium heterosporum]